MSQWKMQNAFVCGLTSFSIHPDKSPFTPKPIYPSHYIIFSFLPTSMKRGFEKRLGSVTQKNSRDFLNFSNKMPIL